jgi:hypothetical protein
MRLNLQNSFEDRKCGHYSLLNFNPFLSIGRQLARNSFEKWEEVTCWFPEEFCANQRNISINRMRAISLCCFRKSSANSKAFGVMRLRTYALINSTKY